MAKTVATSLILVLLIVTIMNEYSVEGARREKHDPLYKSQKFGWPYVRVLYILSKLSKKIILYGWGLFFVIPSRGYIDIWSILFVCYIFCNIVSCYSYTCILK